MDSTTTTSRESVTDENEDYEDLLRYIMQLSEFKENKGPPTVAKH